MVFQLGPKPPLFSLESRQRSASERLAGGAGRGLPFNHKIGKAAAKLPFPFSSRSWKGGRKTSASPLAPLPVPSPGWDRASQASARGARIWEAHGGCLLQPPKLQITPDQGRKSSLAARVWTGSIVPPSPPLPAPLCGNIFCLGPRVGNARRRKRWRRGARNQHAGVLGDSHQAQLVLRMPQNLGTSASGSGHPAKAPHGADPARCGESEFGHQRAQSSLCQGSSIRHLRPAGMGRAGKGGFTLRTPAQVSWELPGA